MRNLDQLARLLGREAVPAILRAQSCVAPTGHGNRSARRLARLRRCTLTIRARRQGD